jgi:hypothetical protein
MYSFILKKQLMYMFPVSLLHVELLFGPNFNFLFAKAKDGQNFGRASVYFLNKLFAHKAVFSIFQGTLKLYKRGGGSITRTTNTTTI